MRKLKLILLAFVLTLTNIKAQDTIVVKKDDKTQIILCKITKVTSMSIFYTESKVGKSLSLSEVVKYTNQKQVDPINKNSTIVNGKSSVMDASNVEFITVKQNTWSLFGFINFRTKLNGYPNTPTMLSEMKQSGYKLSTSPYTYPKVGFLIVFCNETIFIFEK